MREQAPPGMWGNQNLYTADGNAKWRPASRNSVAVPGKLSIESLQDPAIPPPGIHPEELKTNKDCCNKILHVGMYSNTIHNSQKMERPMFLSTGEWVNKMLSVHTRAYEPRKGGPHTHTQNSTSRSSLLR